MTRTIERARVLPPLPEIDDATRKEFLIGAAGLLVLAPYGCGSGGSDGNGGAASGETRTVETPGGQVQIPADPRRVLLVYPHDLANALALGLPVVAGPGEQGQPGAPFPPYLREAFGGELDGVTRIATLPEPNYEEIAALRPDVIVVAVWGSTNYELYYERLEEIAPTVTYAYAEGEQDTTVPWREVLRLHGEQFGRQAAAEEWIARFERRAAGLRERLAPRWSGATYAFIDPYPDKFDLYYGPGAGHVAVTLTEELGLRLAGSVNRLLEDVGSTSGWVVTVSYERLDALEDADVLFVPVYAGPDGAPDRSGVEALGTQPLWSGLPAVRAGRVHEFAGDIALESGPMATAFLGVVERTLLP